MPIIKNHQERANRERVILDMLNRGMSQNEMARDLGVTPQSIHKFLKTRGWKTAAMVQMEERKAATAP